MGWLDKDGTPNQYYAGSHESIYKDYPLTSKIMQDEMEKSEVKEIVLEAWVGNFRS